METTPKNTPAPPFIRINTTTYPGDGDDLAETEPESKRSSRAAIVVGVAVVALGVVVGLLISYH